MAAAEPPIIAPLGAYWWLERGVGLGDGILILIGILLTLLVSKAWILLPAFVGAGLTFTGATDICMMGRVQGARCAASRNTDAKLCPEQKYQESGPIRSIPQDYGTSLAELLGNDQPRREARTGKEGCAGTMESALQTCSMSNSSHTTSLRHQANSPADCAICVPP